MKKTARREEKRKEEKERKRREGRRREARRHGEGSKSVWETGGKMDKKGRIFKRRAIEGYERGGKKDTA